MKKKNEFYKKLGVRPDATSKEIKDAFRQKARELHPDHNPGDKGKEELFKELSGMYMVLSNPAARQHYDNHGEAPRADTLFVEAVQFIIMLFDKIRKQVGTNIIYLDVVSEIRLNIANIRDGAKEEILILNTENERIENLMERVVYKGTNKAQSFIHQVLEKEKQQNKMKIITQEHGFDVFTKAEELLATYQFKADEQKEEINIPTDMFLGGVYYTIKG